MTERKHRGRQVDLTDVYNLVKDEMNAEIRAHGYREVSERNFRQVVKHYFRNIMNRVVYKYQEVELYQDFGTLIGAKILCTRFNPPWVDINKTDGYFYFFMWNCIGSYRPWKLKIAPIWKKRIFQNVRDNGADYPEIYEGCYD